MATLKATLNPRPKKDKTHQVLIRVTHARAVVYAGLDIHLPKKDWHKSGSLENRNWVKAGHPLSDIFNERIAEAIRRLREVAARLEAAGAYTAAQVKARYLAGDAPEQADFVAFFALQVEEKERQVASGEGTYSNFKRHRSVQRKLAAYAPSLPMEKLTLQFLQAYRSHLFTAYGNAPNSVAKDLTVLRTVYYSARKLGLAPPGADPFDGVPLTYEQPRKHTLTVTELKALKEMALPERLHHARNLYLLQFFANGARVGDMMLLRHGHIDFARRRVHYTMQKTGKHVSFRITEGVAWVLGQYLPARADAFLLPFLSGKLASDPHPLRSAALRQEIESKTAVVNRLLKEILKLMGVDKHITTHTARHTFAAVAARSGTNAAVFQGLLGHSSLRETQHYLDEFLEEETDAHSERIYGGI
ncbi:site-specific integrase [Pontibacter saemangeumensis]|uniref:Site-specific integrase n=1 Tax=Pontibacter saemangeumensis TaxID=1084525 RepID=A0ABP8LTE1_9BACT